jgi:hypothetical protein
MIFVAALFILQTLFFLEKERKEKKRKEKKRKMSKAVLFGINYATSDAPLRGCANDVENMAKLLRELEYGDVKVYTEESTPSRVTASGIMNTVWELVAESHRKQLRKVWLHFSGHGVGVRDVSGDEADGQDEAILPLDYKKSGVITDDMLQTFFRYFPASTTVTCVFDCCHSGTVADLSYQYPAPDHQLKTPPPNQARITMISGCLDDQTAADAYLGSEFSGAMTSTLIQVIYFLLDSRGEVRVKKLLKYLRLVLKRRGFTQKPLVTSSRPIQDSTVLDL